MFLFSVEDRRFPGGGFVVKAMTPSEAKQIVLEQRYSGDEAYARFLQSVLIDVRGKEPIIYEWEGA